MRYRAINRHIISRYGLPELRRRLQSADLAAIDLDDCLYPRNSHVELTKNLFLDLPYNYRRPGDLKLMLKVVHGLMLAFCYITGKILRTHVSNRFLLEEYERVMRNMPLHYFEICAADLPKRVYRNSRESVERLSRRMPAGIITVGFDMVVREFVRQFTSRDGATLSFVDANKALFRDQNGERLYEGFLREDAIITAGDKWRHLRRRMQEYGASRPLVIGHRADEILMARHARDLGGISIGFNPDLDVEKEFDLVVKARDWTPVLQLLKGSFEGLGT
jgi:hypothetical protein